jgi:hypothetical protein
MAAINVQYDKIYIHKIILFISNAEISVFCLNLLVGEA